MSETGPAKPHRGLVRQGFVLILLSLLGGVLAPFVVNTRLGMGAHVIGLFGGLFLIAIGLARPLIVLGPGAWRVMQASWMAAIWVNWIAATLAGLTGASRLTPLAGAGTTGTPLAETVVFILFCVVGVTALVGAALGVWGLRRTAGLD